MRHVLLLLASAALLAVLGCGAAGDRAGTGQDPARNAPSPQAPSWAYAPKALELTFVSDPFLNVYDGSAHSLPVCVYQLESVEEVKSLTASAPGISRLLDCRQSALRAVACQRIVVQPGRNETAVLDRAGKARYVAVVCGYYGLNATSAVRVYEIPVSANTSGWLWWKQTSVEAAKLSRKIVLGATGVQDAAEAL